MTFLVSDSIFVALIHFQFKSSNTRDVCGIADL